MYGDVATINNATQFQILNNLDMSTKDSRTDKPCTIHSVSISTLFDDKGMCLNDKRTYFDDEGDLIEWVLIMDNYKNYPANSDIVKMHFAEEYAGETHGNYTASTLFFRPY